MRQKRQGLTHEASQKQVKWCGVVRLQRTPSKRLATSENRLHISGFQSAARIHSPLLEV